MSKAKFVSDEKVSLTKPVECPKCNGHMTLDETFLEQVEPFITCPYCRDIIEIPE